MPHGLDTECAVFCYEQEFYPLSNFSSFRLKYAGIDFDTSEHAYQCGKFRRTPAIQMRILESRSAHEAFRIAVEAKGSVDPGWDDRKLEVMGDILLAKFEQHEYVRRKLIETGDRSIIENSWRDSYWGWGETHLGENYLGKLWMEIRSLHMSSMLGKSKGNYPEFPDGSDGKRRS